MILEYIILRLKNVHLILYLKLFDITLKFFLLFLTYTTGVINFCYTRPVTVQSCLNSLTCVTTSVWSHMFDSYSGSLFLLLNPFTKNVYSSFFAVNFLKIKIRNSIYKKVNIQSITHRTCPFKCPIYKQEMIPISKQSKLILKDMVVFSQTR